MANKNITCKHILGDISTMVLPRNSRKQQLVALLELHCKKRYLATVQPEENSSSLVLKKRTQVFEILFLKQVKTYCKDPYNFLC